RRAADTNNNIIPTAIDTNISTKVNPRTVRPIDLMATACEIRSAAAARPVLPPDTRCEFEDRFLHHFPGSWLANDHGWRRCSALRRPPRHACPENIPPLRQLESGDLPVK